ncbi:PREDICTED: uncharacterized protein LOC109205414 [Nicotiana attenuata]|uniref:uncharacterized protein LOC109205414 n=1 Tax=Nicotiana attenuata TaxID=49451 RepID=UPI0009056911|nr:PREDICTED: uncharacterized protein LOC109205414 [Nicotiana attenuata]
MEDIFKIKQGDSELLREFVDRFQRERMTLPLVPDNWAAMAFASNLNKKSSEATRRLKESLREFPATTWNDVYNRYNTKLRIEEDTISRSQKEEKVSSRRAETEKRSGKNRYEPYMVPAGRDSRSKQDNSRYDHRSRDRESGSSSRFGKDRNARETRDDDRCLKARFGGYNFNISTSELVAVLRSMGDKVRWLKEIRSNPNRRNLDHWCEFHNYHCHKTTDCRLLQGEVDHLLKQGYLTELFSEKGISENIILLRVLNAMQAEDKLVPKAHTLSGFDNSSVVTKGEVVLTTFAEGVVKDPKFQVVEMEMAYNMILGRPWIHEMDVVPSTLHQVIKFPSPWGIRQIRGDQQTSRSINSVADSSTKNEEK